MISEKWNWCTYPKQQKPKASSFGASSWVALIRIWRRKVGQYGDKENRVNVGTTEVWIEKKWVIGEEEPKRGQWWMWTWRKGCDWQRWWTLLMGDGGVTRRRLTDAWMRSQARWGSIKKFDEVPDMGLKRKNKALDNVFKLGNSQNETPFIAPRKWQALEPELVF